MDKIANCFQWKVSCLACCHRDPEMDERWKKDGWLGYSQLYFGNREELCSGPTGSLELKIVFVSPLTSKHVVLCLTCWAHLQILLSFKILHHFRDACKNMPMRGLTTDCYSWMNETWAMRKIQFSQTTLRAKNQQFILYMNILHEKSIR